MSGSSSGGSRAIYSALVVVDVSQELHAVFVGALRTLPANL
jgi:hypothetical protein